MTSERIKKIQEKLPKSTVSESKKMQDILPYLDESEVYVFWLAIDNAFLDGQRNQLDRDTRLIADKLNASKQGGVK